MKKLLVLFLTLIIIAGVVMAQDLGVTTGIELGFQDLRYYRKDNMYLRPMFTYENSFIDGALDIYGELGLPFWSKPKFWMGMDIDFEVGYNLNLAPASTLSFILESMTVIPIKKPVRYNPFYFDSISIYSLTNIFETIFFETILETLSECFVNSFVRSEPVVGISNVQSWLVPGIKFTQELDGFGALYFRLDHPFLFIETNAHAFDYAGLNFTFGLSTDFGFGIETEIDNWLKYPKEHELTGHTVFDFSFLDSVIITPFFEKAYACPGLSL
jgi:hypothetical protein